MEIQKPIVQQMVQMAQTEETLAAFRKSLERLRNMLDIQCSNGNWNYDPYMHGMANGMIFAQSLFDGKSPEFLEAPPVWLKDLPTDDVPVKEEDLE